MHFSTFTLHFLPTGCIFVYGCIVVPTNMHKCILRQPYAFDGTSGGTNLSHVVETKKKTMTDQKT